MSTQSPQAGAPDGPPTAGAPGSSIRPPRSHAPVPASVVRAADPGDVAEILALVRELAEYEQALDEVVATEESLHDLLFGGNTPNGRASAYCQVVPDPDGGPGLAGFALWFLNASTWLGTHGIYLEDLYVRPQFRGAGYGRLLMQALAALCVERGYGRLEWWVLDWNEPAIGFYESLGATAMDEWTVHRLSGPALASVAAGGAAEVSARP